MSKLFSIFFPEDVSRFFSIGSREKRIAERLHNCHQCQIEMRFHGERPIAKRKKIDEENKKADFKKSASVFNLSKRLFFQFGILD